MCQECCALTGNYCCSHFIILNIGNKEGTRALFHPVTRSLAGRAELSSGNQQYVRVCECQFIDLEK